MTKTEFFAQYGGGLVVAEEDSVILIWYEENGEDSVAPYVPSE